MHPAAMAFVLAATLFAAGLQRFFLLRGNQTFHLLSGLFTDLANLFTLLFRAEGGIRANGLDLGARVLFDLAALLQGLLGNASDLPTRLLASARRTGGGGSWRRAARRRDTHGGLCHHWQCRKQKRGQRQQKGPGTCHDGDTSGGAKPRREKKVAWPKTVPVSMGM
jgi:hypothetical protein